MFTLADLIEGYQGTRPLQAEIGITDAVVDSRAVIPASLFIAIEGGHAHVSDAFKNGAFFALVNAAIDPSIPVVDLERTLPPGFTFPAIPFALRVENIEKALNRIATFWRSKFTPRVIGITGSVGKSTTKELVAELLSLKYRTLKNQGNFNNEVGLPLTLLRLGPGYDVAVLEMGMYKEGDIRDLCTIAKPQVGIVSNVGTVHASRASSQEAIARGKSELVQSLPPAPEGTAILNMDDLLVAEMAAKTRARVFFYGLNPKADLWADEIESQGLKGIRFTLHHLGESFCLQAPLIGRHSVDTILRAVSAALVEGLSWGEIVYGLQHSSSQLRLVATHTRQGALVLDDSYNASPESMLAALNLLNELPGRKIAVLGGMNELGQYEQVGHQKVGYRTAEVADKLIAYQVNARMISSAAVDAGLPANSVETIDDPDQVIESLNSFLREGDVVLVKGAHSLRMDRIVQALEVEE